MVGLVVGLVVGSMVGGGRVPKMMKEGRVVRVGAEVSPSEIDGKCKQELVYWG
mgnify:CR=1 FL=1